jgi:hypothetical protein
MRGGMIWRAIRIPSTTIPSAARSIRLCSNLSSRDAMTPREHVVKRKAEGIDGVAVIERLAPATSVAQ